MGIESSIQTVALIGYPNVGKTTLFNALSKKSAKVVNYPGSTVGLNVSTADNIKFIDTPGVRSLTPQSADEYVTINILDEATYIINVLDGTQLQTQLNLTRDLISRGLPMMLVLTRIDLHSFKIDPVVLENELGIRVITLNAKKSDISVSNLVELTKIPKRITTTQPFEWARKTAQRCLKTGADAQNKWDLDKLFLHPWVGPMAFLGIMTLFFYSIYTIATPLLGLVDSFFVSSTLLFKTHLPDSFLTHLLIDGVWTGSGAALIFVPQIFILFLAMGLMEQSGYLARAAMIVDKPLSKVGLNGRSFLPMLSGCACAIPALMATRNIQDKKVRWICQFIVPLMQCSARLPVYGLLLGVLFYNRPLISGIALTSIYLGSFLIAAVIAGLASRVLKVTSRDTTFQLELPQWQVPDFKELLKSSFKQTLEFITNAGPTILVVSVILWGLATYPSENASFAMDIGKFFEPIFLPMGVDWRVGVALLLSFAAREVFVSALAVMFAVGSEAPGDILSTIQSATFEGTTDLIFTSSTSLGLIVFFMIAMQCMATLAVAKQEMGEWKAPVLQLLGYIGLAYILAVFIAQFG
ncbi:ferrous iron transporter B [bacterium]|jgi:ferrous iron transport protein B|nr:ferrous iron transporter B [bacterium]